MFGQSKVAKWLCILALFCFCICGQSLAEEETVIPEEGMRLIAMPRNATAADSVLSITEAYITCDHSMLTLGEEAVWTLNLKGGVSGAYTIDYILLRHAPTDPKNVYTLYSQEMGTTALSYTSLPADTGAYLLQVFIRDQYEGVLEVLSGAYTTDDDAALTQKIAEVLSLCKNSGATTELEIALFMHDYLINHADYDQTYTHYSAHGVLLYGSGTCQSYASAYQILLNKSGMQCLWVDGTTGSEKHCWNLVSLDGVWYQVDCTWDDPIGGNERHDYFLIADEQMAKDHQWNESLYPACTDDRYMGSSVETYNGFTFNGGYGDITITSYTGTEKDVVVPAYINGRKVKRIEGGCFSQNHTMETLAFSEGIEQLAFLFARDCSSLKSITIPSTAMQDKAPEGLVSDVGGFVDGCPYVETIMVADGSPYLCVIDNVLYTKDKTTMIYCPAQNRTEIIHVPEGAKRIADLAFIYNRYVKEVVLPDSVEIIGGFAFEGCSSLEKLNLPQSCFYVGQFAFSGTQLRDLHIPARLASFSWWQLPSTFETITVDEGNPSYYSVDNVLFDKDGELLMYAALKPDTVYTVPEGTYRTASYAFLNATNLEKVVFPDGFLHIGGMAFANCVNLKEVILPDTLVSIEELAFIGCSSLNKLVIPASTTVIAPDIFGRENIFIIYGEKGSAAEEWARLNGYIFYYWWEGVCGENGSHVYHPVVTAPTCTLQGYTTYTCENCGLSYDDDYVPETGHTFGEWVIAKAPTCTEDGKEQSVCVTCNHLETHAIPSTGHDYDSVVTAPTCTEQGYTTYTCANCGDSYVSDYTDATDYDHASATGHSLGEWELIEYATCTANGLERRYCLNCDYYINRSIPASGHTYDVWNTTISPTCTEDGTECRDCANCDHFEIRVIPATGHYLSNWLTVKPAGCVKDGWEYRDCMLFDYHETRVLPATGHDYYESGVVAATCTLPGYTTYTCENCGLNYTDLVPETGHSCGEWVITKSLTCTEDGEEQSVCVTCNQLVTRVIPATGTHEWDAGTVVVERTCTDSGERLHTCILCGITKTERIPPHFWANGVLTITPNAEKPGEITYTCLYCDETKTEEMVQGLAGDVNEDNRVDMLDIIDMMEWYCGGIVELNLANGEVTGEGNIDMLDIIALMEWYCGAEITLCGYAEEVAE